MKPTRKKHCPEERTKGSKTTCTQCNFETFSMLQMRSHQKKAHGVAYDFICDSCGKDFLSTFYLKRHKQMKHCEKGRTTGSKTTCTQCDFETFSTLQMRSHEKKAHGVPCDFICDTCGKDFLSKSRLKRHKLTHERARDKSAVQAPDLKCQLCSYEGATTAKALRRHIEEAHIRMRT